MNLFIISTYITVIYWEIWIVFGLDKIEYVRETNVVVNHVIDTVYASSAVKCCTACREHTGTCVSVSYHNVDNTCRLNDRNPFFDETASKTPSPVWMSFYEQCEQGWTAFGGSCYLFVNVNRPWQPSEDHCQSIGGHLVDFDNMDEISFIQNLMTGRRFGWIGLYEPGVEDVFVWTSGLSYDGSVFHNFKSPRYFVGTAYNCVYTHQSNGLWDTGDCYNWNNPSVCERKM